jgi:hypothetical protein
LIKNALGQALAYGFVQSVMTADVLGHGDRHPLWATQRGGVRSPGFFPKKLARGHGLHSHQDRPGLDGGARREGEHELKQVGDKLLAADAATRLAEEAAAFQDSASGALALGGQRLLLISSGEFLEACFDKIRDHDNR